MCASSFSLVNKPKAPDPRSGAFFSDVTKLDVGSMPEGVRWILGGMT